MRAKYIFETLDFERGKDPKKAMSIGLPKGHTDIEYAMKELQSRYGGEYEIEVSPYYITGRMQDKAGNAVEISYEIGEEDIPFMISYGQGIGHIFKTIDKALDKADRDMRNKINWSNKRISETMDFERGKSPKESMNLGFPYTKYRDMVDKEVKPLGFEIIREDPDGLDMFLGSNDPVIWRNGSSNKYNTIILRMPRKKDAWKPRIIIKTNLKQSFTELDDISSTELSEFIIRFFI